MRIKRTFYIYIFSIAVLLGIIGKGIADTNVSGTISVDTTWTKANSPYVVTDGVSVEEGTTLTIEPGVTIKFNSGDSLSISGILIAKGTSASKITFTRNTSDNWDNIHFRDSSTDANFDSNGNYTDGCVMEYCIVEYAGYSTYYGSIRIENAHPFINYCTIKNNSATGIYASNLSGTLNITNCNITNNTNSNSCGGGIYCSGGTPFITNNTITSNKVSRDYSVIYGGGIYCSDCTPTISNNTISNNTVSGFKSSSYGGGIYCTGGTSFISNNTITNNSVSGGYWSPSYGGGICCSGGIPTISDNTITNNASSVWGGGVYATGGTCTISNNIISNNTVSASYTGSNYFYGCGICCYDGTFSILNNIICNNNASVESSSSFSFYGGGIFCSNGTFTISSNVIGDNSISGNSSYGGGIFCVGASISNNCIARNSAPNAPSIYYSSSSDSQDIKYNTITANKSTDSTGSTYTIYIKSLPHFNYNNIFNNTATYELFNDNEQGTGNLDAKNNWWGTTVDTDIQSKIYDWIDNTTKDYVDYSPFETAVRTDCPIAPPTGLTAVANNGQIALSWSANSESDLAGYKVYWDTDSGHSYKNSADIGNAINYTITGLTSGRYYVTVTAYDTDYNASSDSSDTVINENQTNGNESWYAEESAVRLTTGGTTPTPTASPTPQPSQTVLPTLPPLPTATPSQTPTPTGSGVVYGFVYNADEESLKNVTVSITGGNFSDSTTTDEDGYYEFSGLSEGDYTLTFEKEGYQTYTEDISLTEGETLDMGTIIMETAEKGMIYGYVTNIKGNSVEYVRLRLKGISTKTTRQASSDADGYFEFSDLEADTYIITAKRSGFKPVNQRIKLGDGEVTDIEIVMKRSSRRIVFVEH